MLLWSTLFFYSLLPRKRGFYSILWKISRKTERITSTKGISRFSMIGCSEQHRCVEFDGSEFKNRHDSRVSRFMGRLIPTICKWLAATMASCSIHDCNIGAGPAGSIFTTKTRRIGQLSRADRNWTLSRIGHEWFHRKKYPPIGCTRTRPDFRPFWILSGWSRGPIESPPFSPPRIHQPSSLICNFLRARHSSFLDWEKNYKSMNISNSNHASFHRIYRPV